MCRYITRPAIAAKRLSVDSRGRVVYQYKHAFRDGSTHVVLEPLDFMFRMNGMPRAQGCAGAAIAWLAAAISRGIRAQPKYRPHIVPRRAPGRVDTDKPLVPMTWPLPQIPVLCGTGTSCPMGTASQAGVRDRHRDPPGAPVKPAWRFARSARSLDRLCSARTIHRRLCLCAPLWRKPAVTKPHALRIRQMIQCIGKRAQADCCNMRVKHRLHDASKYHRLVQWGWAAPCKPR
jgi:Putative transposase